MKEENKIKRILVIAYACEPNLGSEPEVGWQCVKQISKYYETWVITRESNKDSIGKELSKKPLKNLHFVFFDYSKWLKFWKKGRRGVHLYYILWQIGTYFIARRLHYKVKFHLAHHLTFVNDWMPSCLVFLPIPYIWGPIGSIKLPFRRGFFFEFGFKSLIYELMRVLIYRFATLNPFLRLTQKKAKKIIAINDKVVSRLPDINKDNFIILPAIGISIDEIEKYTKDVYIKNNKGLRILFAGQLIYWKGITLAIKAYRRFNAIYNKSEFIIAGDGPLRKYIKSFIKRYGLQREVKLLGHLSREELFQVISKSDIFLYPTFEDGGMVVLEAMALGKPVVCLNWGGPGEFITEECGIKVDVISPEQIIDDLAVVLDRLAKSSFLRLKMGESAKNRVSLYCWDKKGKVIKDIYQELLSKGHSEND